MSRRPHRQRRNFKLWFPHWSNPSPGPPRPPAPTPHRSPSRDPTQPKEPPQSSPSPQPTAAARRSQPSPSSSESPAPTPSKKPSPQMNPAELGGKQLPSPSGPTIKPPSPSRAAPAQLSQQVSVAQPATSSTPQGAPDPQPSAALSSSLLPEPIMEPPSLEPRTLEEKITQRISAKQVTEPTDVETRPKHKFRTESTSIDSTQKDHPAESEPEKAKTQFQPPITESQPEEIKNKKSEPELEASKHQKVNEEPEYIPTDERKQPDFKPKHDVGTSKQEKPNETHKGTPEDKTKPIVGLEQDVPTKQASKLNEHFEGIPKGKTAQPNSAPKQDLGTSKQQILDENPKSIDEDKTKDDLEPAEYVETSHVPMVGEKHKEITEQYNKHKPEEMRIPKTLKSHRTHEEFNNDKPQTKKETHGKLHADVNEALDKQLERELTIMGFDAETPRPHPNTGDLVSDTRDGEQEKKIKQKVNGKEINKHESIGKVNKVSISAGPWTSSCDGERANFLKEIREGLSKLVQKLGTGYSRHACSNQAVSVITLAGKNRGATMFVGNEGVTKQGHKGQEKGKIDVASEEERCKHTLNGNRPFAAFINNNVQSINNSILEASKCEEKNPGVHMVVSTKPTEPMSLKGKVEALKTQKATASITTPQKITFEPNMRQCLTGLLMEPGGDDQEDPQKTRRHGCHYSCDEKKKGKENNDESTSMPNRNGES